MHFNTDEGQRLMLMLPPEHAQACVEHAQVLDEAAMVMLGRTVPYGLTWQQYGALSNLLNASRKVERLMAVWWDSLAGSPAGNGSVPIMHKDALDDAFDAINYLAFFIKCARDFNITGKRVSRACVVHVQRDEDGPCINCGALEGDDEAEWAIVYG